jgi:hypothetical protein
VEALVATLFSRAGQVLLVKLAQSCSRLHTVLAMVEMFLFRAPAVPFLCKQETVLPVAKYPYEVEQD